MAAGALEHAGPFLCLSVCLACLPPCLPACLRLSFTSSLTPLTITLPAAVLMVTLSAKSEGLGFFPPSHPLPSLQQGTPERRLVPVADSSLPFLLRPTLHCSLSWRRAETSWSPPLSSSNAAVCQVNCSPSTCSSCSLHCFITKILTHHSTPPCDCPLSANHPISCICCSLPFHPSLVFV